MRALHRKLLRDFWLLRGQSVAICLVMACGVATYVMSMSTLNSLRYAQATYYDQYVFADVFAHLKRAPESVARELEVIPGVATVQTRVISEVTLDVAGLSEPASGRLVSMPRAEGLNRVFLRLGRLPDEGVADEVLVNEAFAEAHGLLPGDRVAAIINGRRRELRIVGVALSPEYVYAIRSGEFLPDNRRFAVFWMPPRQLAAVFDMEGAFNDVALSLAPGASEAEVIRRVDRVLDRYGGSGAYGRSDQLSNKFVSNELIQLRAMALVTPAIFLAVTAFLLHIVFHRLIGAQREQIAVLKAFGYTRWEIGGYYFRLALLLLLAGSTLGVALGGWLGSSLTQLYTRFFRFPVFDYRLTLDSILAATSVSGGAALFGVWTAVRQAMQLPPAEAMRPEPPTTYRPTFAERFGWGNRLPLAIRWVIRQWERQPARTVLTLLGVSLATSMLILGSFVEDAIDYVIDFQFFLAQRQDATVTFVEAASGGAIHDLQHLPGVVRVEPFRSVPIRVRFGSRTRRLGLMGVDPRQGLYRLINVRERQLDLPPEGIVVSAKLAEVLGANIGDVLTIEVLEGRRPTREVAITSVLEDFTDPAAFMRLDALHRLLWEGSTVSGAFLAIDSRHETELFRQLKQTPRVAGVSIKRTTLETFRSTLAENLTTMRMFNLAFAGVIACGVVYNSARISLAERSRDLATLRVLGFTRGEVSRILLGEFALLTAMAIPVGLCCGYVFAWIMTYALDTETQRFPLVVLPRTYAYAALVTVVAAAASSLVVRRRLDRLDLVAVLKAHD